MASFLVEKLIGAISNTISNKLLLSVLCNVNESSRTVLRFMCQSKNHIPSLQEGAPRFYNVLDEVVKTGA